jgi:hypothetical protein
MGWATVDWASCCGAWWCDDSQRDLENDYFRSVEPTTGNIFRQISSLGKGESRPSFFIIHHPSLTLFCALVVYNMKYHSYYYALLSGCLGASASCFAKLAFDISVDKLPASTTTVGVGGGEVMRTTTHWKGNTMNMCHLLIRSASMETTTESWMNAPSVKRRLWSDPTLLCEWSIFVAYRGVCLLGMIVCNIYMIGTFLKGMDESGTIAGTALSTSSNFMVSAAYGYYIWEERYTIHWWMGFTMVCVGMTILTQCDNIKKHSITSGISNDHVKHE